MAEWKHRIPVTTFFPTEDTNLTAIRQAAQKIQTSLMDHRAFLRYVELPEEEITEFEDIADDFHHAGYTWNHHRIQSAEDFDEAMTRLYDWADKNQIWID